MDPRAIDRRSQADLLGGPIPHARFSTIVILLANFGLYLASTLYSMRAGGGGGFSGIDGVTLVSFGAKYGPAIAAGQWWRLVTAGFLHGGMLHILMNCSGLFFVAPQLEEMCGASRMWVIYFISSAGGFYLSDLWNPRSLSVGASAALCGLIGAMIALGTTYRLLAMGALMTCIVFSALLLPGMDMAAHIGGGVAGFGVAYLAGTPRLEGSGVERLWQAGALICLGLTGLSFALWWIWFSHTA